MVANTLAMPALRRLRQEDSRGFKLVGLQSEAISNINDNKHEMKKKNQNKRKFLQNTENHIILQVVVKAYLVLLGLRSREKRSVLGPALSNPSQEPS